MDKQLPYLRERIEQLLDDFPHDAHIYQLEINPGAWGVPMGHSHPPEKRQDKGY